ncbi:beta-ketoacyl synthase N-terminal-like domain-containing protein, partial [Spirillospora sp. NPDC049652]
MMPTVVTAMAVVSPLGLGTGAFADAVRRGRLGACGHVPDLSSDPDFAATKQVRLYERSSALAVGAVAKLLADDPLGTVPAERRAIVLGSALAGIDTFMGVDVASLTGARPYHVDHKRVPAAVMNYTSAQAAIRFDLRGPNVTVSAGRASGLT